MKFRLSFDSRVAPTVAGGAESDLVERSGSERNMQKKKPWSKPEVRSLPVTDELLDLIARNTSDQGVMPVKRPM
jgi:hypothetical protein